MLPFRSISHFLILAALCAITAPYMVLAQSNINEDVPTSANDPIAIYRQAGINPPQEKKILALANDYEKNAQTKMRAVIVLIQQLRKLSLSPDLNEQAVLDTQDSISKLQTEMAKEKVRLLINIRRLLNGEQRQKLVGLLQKQRSEPSSGAQ